jgi:hypothetical protein
MAKALTVQSVGRFKPDRHKRVEVPDGLLPGLYFVLQPSGVRSWAVRYRHARKSRKLTLGPTLPWTSASPVLAVEKPCESWHLGAIRPRRSKPR